MDDKAVREELSAAQLRQWLSNMAGHPAWKGPCNDSHFPKFFGEAAEFVKAQAAELATLRQACWDARAVLGFDNDGAPTPAARMFPTMAELVKRDAAEFRKDYDEACTRAETAERRCAELVGVLKESLAGWDHVVEELELNGYHDHPDFQYRTHKQWLSDVETKAATLTGDDRHAG